MKTTIALLLLAGSFCGHAQDIDWEKSYGGRQAEYLFDVQPKDTKSTAAFPNPAIQFTITKN